MVCRHGQAHITDAWGMPWVCQVSYQTPLATAAALVCGVARRITFSPGQAPQGTSLAVRRGLDLVYRFQFNHQSLRQFPVTCRVSKSCALSLADLCNGV